MGIVKMNRLTLVGLAREKEAVLAALSKLGAVEIREIPEQTEAFRAQQADTLAQIQQHQAQRQLLESILPQARDLLPGKKPLFTLKRTVSMKDFMRFDDLAVRETVLETAAHFRDALKEVQELKARRAALNLQSELLKPWQSALGDQDPSHSRRIHRWLGRVTHMAQLEQIRAHLEAAAPAAILEVLSAPDPKQPVYALLAAPASMGDLPLIEAQTGGFKPLVQKQARLTPQEEYERTQQQLEETDQAIEAAQARTQDLAAHAPRFEELSDYLAVLIEREEVSQRVPVTGRLFALEGYIPAHLAKGTQKGLEETYCVSLQMKPADRAKDYPILLHNNPLVRPYEAITDMFSAPAATEVDPAPAVAPFYCLFFGMMFSDIAYGLIFCLMTGFLIWKVKVQGNFRKMCQVFFQCGLSSIVFGALFGGFFGNLINEFSNNTVVFNPLWFDPLKDPTRLMLWSIVLGVLHIFVGLGVKIKILIATDRWQEAVFDVAPWYFILGGLGLWVAGYSLHADTYTLIGKYAALFGAVVVLLMAGRPSWNPILRLLKGFGSLYGITAYFSDVMSYTRIMALALSTSVIAMVVNILSLLPGKSIFGLIFFAVVALLGHTMNLALSALSAYVHTTRLHYVEFFGKFLDGGGRVFSPLAYHTKYVQILPEPQPKPQTESLRKRYLRFRGAQE